MGLGYGGRWIDRVADSIETTPGLTIIAAPPGFGVSVLTERLRTEARHPDGRARRRQHPHLAVLADVAEADIRSTVVGALEADFRVVVTGRSIPEAVRQDASQIVDHAIMRLEESEALDLARKRDVPDAVARAIWVFTGGWPAYYLSCVVAAKGAQVDSGTEAYDLLRTGPHLGNLIRNSLDALDQSDRSKMGQLAHFGRLSQGVINASLGSNGAHRVKAAGVPLVETAPGWYEILNPVSLFLRAETELDEQTATELAPTIVSDVGVVTGARLFLEAGHPAAAATALRGVALQQLDEGSQESLLPVLRTVLDTEKDDGSLGLRLARVLQNHGDLGLQRRALVEASISARDQLRPDLAIEAEAEILLLDLQSIEPHEAIARHQELVREARAHSSSLAQIRLREVHVFLSTESGELAKVYRSVGQLESVAHEWSVVGEPARAASTLRVLSTTALFYLGRYSHARDALQRACDLSKGQPQSLAKSTALLVRMTALLGDIDRFEELQERGRQLQESAGLAWVDAYLAWSEMIAAGYRQDIADVVSSRRRAEALLGPLLEHETGLVFICEAAAAHAMAGDVEHATELVNQAKLRSEQSPLEVDFVEIFVRSRAGLDTASLAGEMRRRLDVPVERDWRIDLELALAGEDSEHLAKIEKEASRHGLAELFDALVRTSNHDVRTKPVQINLLGDFSIALDGEEQRGSSSKALDLIKFLAVRAKPVQVDVVIDHLWGDVSSSVGSRRLKNVVARAREIIGTDAVVRSDQMIGLGRVVKTDVAVLDAELSAFRATGRQDVALAVSVVNAYAGPLLELDMYIDWIDIERRALAKAVALALHRVVQSGSKSGAWAFDAQRRVDATDDSAFMNIARYAETQRDFQTLQQCLDVVERICLAIEIDTPADFERLTNLLDLLD